MATSPSASPPFPPPTVMAFVDAGYLTAGAQAQLRLPFMPRIDGQGLTFWASTAWTSRRGGDLLRTYVYEAQFPAGTPKYADQRTYFDALGAQPGIRLRLGPHLVERALGTPRARWEQKGVDTLLVLDLVRLAQLRAFDTAVIVAGDRDLAEAVRVVADDHARRVILYSVKGSPPAKQLVEAADDHGPIDDHLLRTLVGQHRAGVLDATPAGAHEEHSPPRASGARPRTAKRPASRSQRGARRYRSARPAVDGTSMSGHQVMIHGGALHPPSPLRSPTPNRAVSWVTRGTVGSAVILP